MSPNSMPPSSASP